MRINWWNRVLMDQAGADGAASGGADGAAADDKPGGEAKPGDASLLDDLDVGAGDEGAAGDADAAADAAGKSPEELALKAAEKDTRRPKSVPAKFWNAEKGEVNYDGWAKSHKDLEGRMKNVGLPPESADGYKYEPPAEIKALGVDLDPDATKAIREEALAQGFSQKQYEWVMNKYFSSLQGLVEHGERYDKAKTMTALTEHYKTPDAIRENVKAAYDVFSAFADEDEMKDIYRVVNDPIAVRVLAKINKELKEDPGISPDAIVEDSGLEELMAQGSPYWDSKHPQHARVKAKVTNHFEAQARAKQRKRAA